MAEVNVIYRGTPAWASALAQVLEEAGATVSYEPPEEQRGAGGAIETVVLMVVGGLTKDAVAAAIKSVFYPIFKRRGHLHPEVTIDGDVVDSGEDDE